jgi:hypothetical protein
MVSLYVTYCIEKQFKILSSWVYKGYKKVLGMFLGKS